MRRADPRLLLIGAFIAAGILILDPFGLMRSGSSPARSELPAEHKARLVDWVEAEARAPEQYLAKLFERRQIVFLGEYGRIREQVELLTSALELLHAAGVTRLGLVHLRVADQTGIDRLISADEFDREQAARLLFNRKVVWGYREYVDLLEAVWRMNREAPPTRSPMRVIGLGMRPDYYHLRSPPDLHDRRKMQSVFTEGVPDRVIADTIEREIIAPGHRALIFTPIEHSFTRYEDRVYREHLRRIGIPENERAGNYIYDQIGDRAATVLLHSPWPDQGSSGGVASPADGAIEALIPLLPVELRRGGIEVATGPLSELPIGSSDYREHYDALTLGELTDGYILLGPIAEYRTVTALRGFITAGNLETAIRYFPGPTPDGATVTGMNAYLERANDEVRRTLRMFR